MLLVYATLLVTDSTPIPDSKDSDAKKGKTGRGWFIGFKVHKIINQLKIPLRAIFTTGNRYDGPILRQRLIPTGR